MAMRTGLMLLRLGCSTFFTHKFEALLDSIFMDILKPEQLDFVTRN